MPDPTTPLWRAAQVFRLLSYIYALGFQIAVNRRTRPPAIGWLLFAVLSGGAGLRDGLPAGVRSSDGVGARRVPVVVALILSTQVVASDDWVSDNQSWPTTLWATNATISAAILLGPIAGMLTGLVVMAVYATMKGYVSFDLARNATIVIELAVGLAVGMAAQTARRAHAELERAAGCPRRWTSGSGCPQVHDGVMQVLALVAGAAVKSAVRQRNWPNSPASRSARCGGWSVPTDAERATRPAPRSTSGRCCGAGSRTGCR